MIFGMERPTFKKTALDKKRAFKLIATAGIALSLQGCIAAAFPVVAGGLMARGSGSDAETESTAQIAAVETPPAVAAEPPVPAVQPDPEPEGIVEVARSTDAASSFGTGSASDSGTFAVEDPASTALVPEPAAPAETVQASERLVTESESSAALASAAPTSTLPAAPSALDSSSSTAPTVTVRAPSATSVASTSITNTGIANTPESSSIVIPIPDAPPAVAGGTFFDPLFSYATTPETSESGARTSAVLLDAAALKPDRIDCATGEPTVLIDLDPESGDLFPIDTRSASPAFAQKLAELRVRGVLIAWISQNFSNRENDVRRALLQSGLDPLGTDQVLMMRTSDDRKQTRRDELARGSCLVAIAGDTRADFHELFDYLLNPGDAAALEPLIGEGWFLIPTPLLAERTRP